MVWGLHERCKNSKGEIYRKGISCNEGMAWFPRQELLENTLSIGAVEHD